MPPKHKQTRVPVCVIRKQQKKLQPALKAAEVGATCSRTFTRARFAHFRGRALLTLARFDYTSIQSLCVLCPSLLCVPTETSRRGRRHYWNQRDSLIKTKRTLVQLGRYN
jgi:hypothetical protein